MPSFSSSELASNHIKIYPQGLEELHAEFWGPIRPLHCAAQHHDEASSELCRSWQYALALGRLNAQRGLGDGDHAALARYLPTESDTLLFTRYLFDKCCLLLPPSAVTGPFSRELASVGKQDLIYVPRSVPQVETIPVPRLSLQDQRILERRRAKRDERRRERIALVFVTERVNRCYVELADMVAHEDTEEQLVGERQYHLEKCLIELRNDSRFKADWGESKVIRRTAVERMWAELEDPSLKVKKPYTPLNKSRWQKRAPRKVR